MNAASPRVLFAVSLAAAACSSNVTTTGSSATTTGAGGATTTSSTTSTTSGTTTSTTSTTTSTTTTSTTTSSSTTTEPVDGGACTPPTGCACAVPSDCGAGFDCYTPAPGGYCLPGAPGGPTACHLPDAPCPDGTVCSPLPWSQISGVCMRACGTPADCRPGYVCGVVELFPGDPNTPKSPAPVCWTVCQPGMDQTCNDNPVVQSTHGTCEPDGTCTCKDGFAKNPKTGRCL